MVGRSKINAVVCGFTPIGSLFLNVLSSLDRLYNLCGYWGPKDALLCCNLCLKKIDCTFDELRKCSQYDVLFICFSPYIQSKLLTSILKDPESLSSETVTPERPTIILLPPISISYSVHLLRDYHQAVFFASPLRKLDAVSLLSTHLKVTENLSSHQSSRISQLLPLHWKLGLIRSLHVRLSVTNPISAEQYSWLCEAGATGGGLINIYGPELVDLAFHLTGGSRITSLTCLCRTFDERVCSNTDSIRRINAEDYFLVSAELEPKSPGSSRPVVMFCISADLPSSSLAENNLTSDGFALNVELSGSIGRFVIPASGDRICWNKVGTVLSIDDATRDSSDIPPIHNGIDNISTVYSKDLANTEPTVNGASNTSEKNSLKFRPVHKIQLQQNGVEEIALITSYPPTDAPSETLKRQNGILTEAWSQWLSQLSIALRSQSTKQCIRPLVASPEHWGYIQRVVKAMDKAARLRSWIDVETGERI